MCRSARLDGLLAAALPELERTETHDLAAMGYGLLGRCASAGRRHAAAIRAVRHAIRLAGSTTWRGVARRGPRPDVRSIGIVLPGSSTASKLGPGAATGEPAYEAYATKALAQALMMAAVRRGHHACSKASS